MKFSINAPPKRHAEGDLLVIPLLKDKKKPDIPLKNTKWLDQIHVLISTGDFKGKEGEIAYLYPEDLPQKRMALLGMGETEKITIENLRRVFGSLVKSCHAKKIRNIEIHFPKIPGFMQEDLIRGMAEGLLLPNYQFTKLKHDSLKDNTSVLIENVNITGIDPGYLKQFNKSKTICESVYFARDLVNGNADEVTPQFLVRTAQSLANSHTKIKATIFDKKRIEKEQMGLLLAVNRGSDSNPAFIILEYKGSAKSKEHTVLIGKGITYDTGGLNLKSSGMETMKADMAGAAMALATVKAAAELKLPVHLTAVIPTTENSISASSYKPGDVYRSYSGKMVEITNTDAEGRLILADALSYAEKNLKPTCLITFATLTGAMDIIFGSEAMGMMTNNDALADLFTHAGSATFERVWRLPLFEEYKEHLNSDVADIKNYGSRSASSITAAIFLQQFLSNQTPWIHFDIARTAYSAEPKRYNPRFATGCGVRLMIEFLQ